MTNFSNVAGYEINTPNQQSFCGPNLQRKQSHLYKYTKETIPYTITLKQIPCNKPNQGSERPVQCKLLNTEQRNRGRHYRSIYRLQKMEISPVLMVRQNKYCENGHPTKSNLQIQCTLDQNFSSILHRNRKQQYKGMYGRTEDSWAIWMLVEVLSHWLQV